MSKTEKQVLGDLGEGAVCGFLVKQGYSVLHRNFRKPWGEIDIVAKKGPTLHFVEVKTVSHGTVFSPEGNAHALKMSKVARTAETYLLEMRVPHETTFQIDLACVWVKEGMVTKIELIEDVLL